MTTFPRSPRILKAGIVLLDPLTSQVARIVVLQYNPEQLQRTLQVQATSGKSGDRSEALRLKGPPIETFKLEAEIDATDQLEFPDQNPVESEVGIFPELAALKSLISPTSGQLADVDRLLTAGAVEITPMEAPLAVFVWSAQRIVPVRVTEFSVTEEAFDVNLNPIRAKVSLGMRTLSVNDFGFDHKGSSLFLSYLKNKEALARRSAGGSLGQLGLQAPP